MIIVGVLFNPMNILAYMSHNHFNYTNFYFGIILSLLISLFLLRKQFLVSDREWLKRMISHHSTALTTSYKIYNKTNNKKIKNLAKNIIITQEKEIEQMILLL